jgi:hypothetical protein
MLILSGDMRLWRIPLSPRARARVLSLSLSRLDVPCEEAVLEALVSWRLGTQHHREQEQHSQSQTHQARKEGESPESSGGSRSHSSRSHSSRCEEEAAKAESIHQGFQQQAHVTSPSDTRPLWQTRDEEGWRSLMDCVRFGNMSSQYLQERAVQATVSPKSST